MAETAANVKDSSTSANIPVDGVSITVTPTTLAAGQSIRQGMAIGDGAGTAGQFAVVTTRNALQIEGVVNGTPQPIQGAGLSSVTGTLTASGSSVAISLNVASAGNCTITAHGTYVANLTFEATDDGTNWYPIQGSRMEGVYSEQTTGLLSSVSRAWDFGCSGITNIRVWANVYTSGTVNIKISAGTFPHEPAPTVTGNVGIIAVPSRVPWAMYFDTGATVTGVTTEALLSCTTNNNGTVATSQTSFTVPTGYRLHISLFKMVIAANTAASTAANVRLRALVGGGTLATTSPVYATLAAATTAVIGASGSDVEPITMGKEFPAGAVIGFSHVESAANVLLRYVVSAVGFLY